MSGSDLSVQRADGRSVHLLQKKPNEKHRQVKGRKLKSGIFANETTQSHLLGYDCGLHPNRVAVLAALERNSRLSKALRDDNCDYRKLVLTALFRFASISEELRVIWFLWMEKSKF